MLERLGIADELAERRKQFARYAYRAPQDRLARMRAPAPFAVDLAVPAPAPTPAMVISIDFPEPLAVEKPIRIVSEIRPRGATNKHKGPETDPRGRMADVIVTAAAVFGISVSDFLGPSRKRRFAYPRFAASHFLFNVLRISLPSIGKATKRDHTTILSSIRKAAELRRTDIAFAGRSRMLARELRRKWAKP